MGKVRRHYIHFANLRVSLVFDLPSIVCYHICKRVHVLLAVWLRPMAYYRVLLGCV